MLIKQEDELLLITFFFWIFFWKLKPQTDKNKQQFNLHWKNRYEQEPILIFCGLCFQKGSTNARFIANWWKEMSWVVDIRPLTWPGTWPSTQSIYWSLHERTMLQWSDEFKGVLLCPEVQQHMCECECWPWFWTSSLAKQRSVGMFCATWRQEEV